LESDHSLLNRLQSWYASQCDGDWEHDKGVSIDTLDNPGWRICINLVGTTLESRPFEEIEIDRTEEDWLRAWVEDGSWNGAGGALNLRELLTAFLDWSDD
jgi:hypothetical protein